MSAPAGTCVLIIDGRRSDHFELSVPVGVDFQVFAFLSGPIQTLKRAQRAWRLQLEVSDGTLLDIALSQLNDAGIALVVIDPRTIPAALRPQQISLPAFLPLVKPLASPVPSDDAKAPVPESGGGSVQSSSTFCSKWRQGALAK
jgi:hypothetical protein